MAGSRADRRCALAGLHGVVVEIGFGTGINVPFYPEEVERVYAVDPSAASWRLAARRVRRSAVPVELIGADVGAIPLADGSVDAALSTFTLCTVPDAAAGLREVGRVLRKGGVLHFLEHGLSPEPVLACWQHRLDRAHHCLAACHLDRPIDELISAAGFEILALRQRDPHRFPCRRPWGHLYQGLAVRPAP